MAYCRFSSDNWKSEVYAFADNSDTYRIYVAHERFVGDAPHVPPVGEVISEKWLAAHKAQMDWLETVERVPIGGPRDGATIITDTEAEMYAELRKLRDEGYHVPDFVFEDSPE